MSNIDYRELHNKFIEIVAIELNALDQIRNGVIPPHSITDGWRERYIGIDQSKLPPYTVQLNTFKMAVDSFVTILMLAVREQDKGEDL